MNNNHVHKKSINNKRTSYKKEEQQSKGSKNNKAIHRPKAFYTFYEKHCKKNSEY